MEITDPRLLDKNPWRRSLMLGWSFRGVPFYVEQQARTSGRRNVEHEYPKRDNPYAEDMGRHAIRYTIQGFLIGPNYLAQKWNLIAALEGADAGTLVDPLVGSMLMMCDRYSVTETRERGGYCVFEMSFAEAGIAGNSLTTILPSTSDDVNSKANNAAGAAGNNLDNQLSQSI